MYLYNIIYYIGLFINKIIEYYFLSEDIIIRTVTYYLRKYSFVTIGSCNAFIYFKIVNSLFTSYPYVHIHFDLIL